MKRTLFSLVFLLAAAVGFAQTSKNVIYRVATGDITYTQPVSKKATVGSVLGDVLKTAAGSNTQNAPEYADAVRDAIVGAFGAARRLRMIDGRFQPDELAPGETAYYIDGTIASITITSQNRSWKDKNGKTHTSIEYRANITGTVNIKDARTDIIFSSIAINSGDYSTSWVESQANAMGNAISRMKSVITGRLNSYFPLYASIIEGGNVKKDKQKEVYIDLGEQDGAFKGMTFRVYSVKIVAGKEAKTEIGRLKITEVEGEDISLCKVTKGGKDIKGLVDAGAKLLITSSN